MEEQKRRRPVLLKRCEIRLEGYEGWWVDIRTNVEMQVFRKLDAGDFDVIYPALVEICRGSNFVDDDGAPIDVTKPADWPKVDIGLLQETCELIKEAVQAPLARAKKTDSSPTSTDTPSS